MSASALQFIVYIDEAGDEGFGKLSAAKAGGQSRWLVIGACILTRENDLKMPTWRDAILRRFPQRKWNDLHFRDLNHDQKIVVCQEISALPIGACVTLSHKKTIVGSTSETTFKAKGYLYNFLIRWLLERVTEICHRRARGRPYAIKVVFSRRGGTDYQAMKDYLILMRDGNEVVQPYRSIVWSGLDIEKIAVENHSKWAGLQIADCITSAFFKAVEPNAYGNYEPAYAKLLKSRLIASPDGSILNCGVTPVPALHKCGADHQQTEFFNWFLKK